MSSTFSRDTQEIPATGWTDDQVEKLKTSWLNGWSAGEIAKVLPFSRSAILGKVDRLGLNRMEGGMRKPRSNVRSNAERPKSARSTSKPAKVGVPYHLRRFETIKADTDPGLVKPLIEESNDGIGLQLAELTNETCRWPKGTPGYDDFCFCGVIGANFMASKPYCPRHSAVARK